METPILRVSRPVSACARCRNAKIKCDGKLPACTACDRIGKGGDCSSANDQFAKGKERSYVASLEARIERLESQVAHRRYMAEAGRHGSGPNSMDIHVRPPKKKDALDVNELVSEFGYLSVNATASGYHGFAREMSFARLVLSTACLVELPPSSSSNLPGREQAYSLIQECRNKILKMYPILSETGLYGPLERIYQHGGRFASPFDRWNLSLVLAISSHLRSKSRSDADALEGYRLVNVALRDREAVLQPGSVAAVQAIALLVLYSLFDPIHFSPWSLIGITSRVMVDIGLHQESPKDQTARPAAIAFKRQLFYCVYNLDRLISMTYGRAFSFSDSSVTVAAPQTLPMSGVRLQNLDLEIGSLNKTTIVAEHLTCYRKLQSTFYQSVWGSSRGSLDEPWYPRASMLSDLAEHISGYTAIADPWTRLSFQLELNYASILLLEPPHRQGSSSVSLKALLIEFCQDYATRIWGFTQAQPSSFALTGLDLQRTLTTGNCLIHAIEYMIGTSEDMLWQPAVSRVHYIAMFSSLQHQTKLDIIGKGMKALGLIESSLLALAIRFGADEIVGDFVSRLNELTQKTSLQSS